MNRPYAANLIRLLMLGVLLFLPLGNGLSAQSVSRIWTVAWNPDGTKLLTVSLDDVVRVWDVATETRLAYAGPEGTIRIVPVAEAGLDQTLTDSDGDGTELVALDGSASTDSDGSITRYEWQVDGAIIATGANPEVEVPVSEHLITLVVTDDDGLTAMGEVVISVTSSETSTPAASQSTTVILSLAWNPNGTVLGVGGEFGGQRALKLIDTDDQIIQQFDMQFGVEGISWRPDSAQIAAYSAGEYTIWDANTGAVMASFRQTEATATPFLYWNPTDFDQIATVERDLVHLRDASTGHIQATLNGSGGKPDSVLSVGWSKDGTTLYTVSNDNLIRVWDVRSATLLNEIPLNFGTQAFAMSPDRTRLAIAGEDGVVHVYDTSGALLLSSERLPDVPTRTFLVYLQWHPDSTHIAGADNQGIHVWDIETGLLVNSVPYQTQFIIQKAMAFSPEGALTYPSGDLSNLVFLAPIAEAGPDQTLTDSDGDGTELVALDGSASTDSDGSIVRYEWQVDGAIIATGANPEVELPVGEHPITLVVTDDEGATGGDVLVIIIEGMPTANPWLSIIGGISAGH